MFFSSFFHQILGFGEPSASQDSITVEPLFTFLYSGATIISGTENNVTISIFQFVLHKLTRCYVFDSSFNHLAPLS